MSLTFNARETLEAQTVTVQVCCLCGGEIDKQPLGNGHYWEGGHNAQPLKDGRCCTACNYGRVIPHRVKQVMRA
ncbi:unnamed protein product [marine sediment metagenome]|uniref:Uncharacterized protein n=1 Tax=marine sediment metagenome TaxID=412755 RepID=X0RN14_9ZZZZ